MSKYTEKISSGSSKYLFFGAKVAWERPLWHLQQRYILHHLARRRFYAARTRCTAFQAASAQQFVGKGETPVEGVGNLHALEIETAATVEKYRENTRGKILDFLKYADIPSIPRHLLMRLPRTRHSRSLPCSITWWT